jgi:hypothetical protein
MAMVEDRRDDAVAAMATAGMAWRGRRLTRDAGAARAMANSQRDDAGAAATADAARATGARGKGDG